MLGSSNATIPPDGSISPRRELSAPFQSRDDAAIPAKSFATSQFDYVDYRSYSFTPLEESPDIRFEKVNSI